MDEAVRNALADKFNDIYNGMGSLPIQEAIDGAMDVFDEMFGIPVELEELDDL